MSQGYINVYLYQYDMLYHCTIELLSEWNAFGPYPSEWITFYLLMFSFIKKVRLQAFWYKSFFSVILLVYWQNGEVIDANAPVKHQIVTRLQTNTSKIVSHYNCRYIIINHYNWNT
jgi:hypothetical protein